MPGQVKRRAVAKALFIYSFLCTVLGIVVHIVVAILWRPELIFSQDNLILWLVLYGVQAAAMTYTFSIWGGEAYESGWSAVVDPSPNAIRIGRSVLVLALGNVVFWAVQFVRLRGEYELFGVMSAAALFSAVYLAAIWGLRTENVFSPGYVAATHGDPILSLSTSVMRAASAKRRAIPFGQWMTGLLECCELAARSTSAVRDATDCKDPRVVDCVEFTYEVLNELESRACVIHHRDKLSHEGHRAIKRFAHSVALISAVSPDPVKWQNIVNDAQSVLAIRDRLIKGDALERGS